MSHFSLLRKLTVYKDKASSIESYLIVSVIVVGLDSLHQLCKGSLILPVDDSFSSFRALI